MPILEAYPRPEPFHDVQAIALQEHDGQRVVDRSWTSTTGITLHQTACRLGLRPDRWKTVGAHFGVMRNGAVVQMHKIPSIVAHGQGWNTRCVGIEVDGLYRGLESDPNTVWDDPSTPFREKADRLDPVVAEATRALIRYICSEVERNHGAIRALVAHRQSRATRENDPGESIWRQVALPIHAELGLTDGGIGFTLGGGKPIPEDWDPRCKGYRY